MDKNEMARGLADRLALLIQYHNDGVQKDFADYMGWQKQYVSKLLRGDSFGLAPVIALAERFPEVDTRWLLTGRGRMLDAMKYARDLVAVDRFVPVMSDDELKAMASGRLNYDQTDVDRWEAAISVKNEPTDKAFRKAYEVQKLQIVCKSK